MQNVKYTLTLSCHKKCSYSSHLYITFLRDMNELEQILKVAEVIEIQVN